MIDRNVEFPNRFQLQKVQGTDDIYDIIPAPGDVIAPGDLFSKGNMLPDSIPRLLGLKMENPQVKDALNVLANVGNLHVWKRVQSGVTDYLTSTDRNAYPDNATDAQDAYYTLGDARRIVFYSGNDRLGFKYGDAITVSDDGKTIDIKNPSYQEWYGSNINNVAVMSGKFMRFTFHNNTDYGTSNPVYFMPSTSKMEYDSDGNVSAVVQPVTGHAAIPANTTITYLGQLGGGARIEVGSYVGTGTYWSSNPNSLTFGFEPKLVAIFAPSKNGNYAYKLFMLRNVLGASILDSDGNNNGVVVTWSEKSVTWYAYGSKNTTSQMNESNYTYHYIAIG